MRFPSLLPFLRFLSLALALGLAAAHAADKRVLLIAGKPSHPPGEHEFNAGVQLFAKCLAGVPGLKVDVALNGWPADAARVTTADAVVVYSDGGKGHPALGDDHLAQLDQVAAHGGGIGFMHYAVEPTKEKGEAEFLRWVGGAFEVDWSVNPHWDAEIKSLPTHPITRGVQPFTLRDEWYFNMRFADKLSGLTPLLVAVPDASTTSRADGPHEGNPAVRQMVPQKWPQILSWAFERPDGGRGFGFTGGHFHKNWANENERKFVLNAIAWLAKLEVPANGIESSPTAEELAANLDPKPPRKQAEPTKK